MNLLNEQTAILKSIFSFGQPPTENEDDDDAMVEVGDHQKVPRSLFTFKALLYDQHAQSLIAPLMNLGALRECNIVYNANVMSKREPIPDLPVIYLVEPTPANFSIIARDAKDKLYDMMIVHFTKPTDSLQEFAGLM